MKGLLASSRSPNLQANDDSLDSIGSPNTIVGNGEFDSSFERVIQASEQDSPGDSSLQYLKDVSQAHSPSDSWDASDVSALDPGLTAFLRYVIGSFV